MCQSLFSHSHTYMCMHTCYSLISMLSVASTIQSLSSTAQNGPIDLSEQMHKIVTNMVCRFKALPVWVQVAVIQSLWAIIAHVVVKAISLNSFCAYCQLWILLCSCGVLTVCLLLQDHVRDANLSMLLQTVYPPDLLEAHGMFQDALKVW